MFLTSVRYRVLSQETWNFLRFPSGHGGMKNVQIITSEMFQTLHEVFFEGLLGSRSSQQNLEVVIQFHDMDGSSWSLFRKPGSFRMTKDGEAVDAGQSVVEIIKKALGQLSLTTEADIKNKLYAASHGIFEKNRLFAWKYGDPQPGQIGLNQLVSQMLDDLQTQFCLMSGIPNKKNIGTILEFTEQLSSLHGKITLTTQWLNQWTALQNGQINPEVNSVHDNQLITLKSAKELGIMAEIHRLASPLTAPHVTPLQVLEKQRAQLNQQIESLESLIGARQAETELPQFEKAIDSLCRFQAYSKLLKSTQELREYCDHDLDPKLKAYIEHAEHMGSDFRKLLEEIQSEQFVIQQQKDILIPPLEESHGTNEDSSYRGSVGKTWFDRLKGPSKAPPASAQKQQASREKLQLASFLAKVSKSIDTIVTKGVEIMEELPAVDTKHGGLSSSLEESLNTLTQRYTKAREDWSEIAKKYNLANDMDLSSLVKVAVIFSRLVMMRERRQWLEAQVKDYTDRIQKLEKLILQWRKLTDSQKIDSLDHPQLIIQESLAITRYMDTKIKRFEQLKEKFSEQNLKMQSMQFVKTYFEEEFKNLIKNWRDLFLDLGASYMPPEHVKIRDILQIGTKIRNIVQIKESYLKLSEDDKRTPALIEILLLNQIYSEESMQGVASWLREQCEIRNPFRSLLIATDHEELIKTLTAQGASLGILTTRNSPQATSSQVNTPAHHAAARAPAPGRNPSPLMESQQVQGLQERAEGVLPHSRPTPTPTLRKNHVGPPSSGDRGLNKNETSESLQMRAERVLAMLSPKDTSKMPR